MLDMFIIRCVNHTFVRRVVDWRIGVG